MTKKQEAARKFIVDELNEGRLSPTHQEIADRFGYASTYAAACHIHALLREGALLAEEGKARALRVGRSVPGVSRPVIAEIPLFGSIPAGLGEDRNQEAEGCVAVDVKTIGFTPNARTFCLRVVGDSMIGKHICSGDTVVLDHGAEPRPGDVVAALIDGKSTLKTFMRKGGKTFLWAENPKFRDLVPSEELVIQGVVKSVIRKL